MNFRLRFFKTLPQIQHQTTYFLFISSFILQFIGFCPAPTSYIGDDYFHQKLIKVSNSFGKDYYVGFWRYCVVEHFQDIDNEIYDPAGLELIEKSHNAIISYDSYVANDMQHIEFSTS